MLKFDNIFSKYLIECNSNTEQMLLHNGWRSFFLKDRIESAVRGGGRRGEGELSIMHFLQMQQASEIPLPTPPHMWKLTFTFDIFSFLSFFFLAHHAFQNCTVQWKIFDLYFHMLLEIFSLLSQTTFLSMRSKST